MKIAPFRAALGLAIVGLLGMEGVWALEIAGNGGAATAGSGSALALLDVDFDKTPGFILSLKGGYQWKFFRDGGLHVQNPGAGLDHGFRKNTTENGLTGSAGLGYNFGSNFPLTLGVLFGFSPGGTLKTDANFASAAGEAYSLHARQKVRIHNLDFNLDYDFKTCGRWTPFVGAIVGVGLVRDKGHASLTNLSTGESYAGGYDKKHHINLVTGARLGTKWHMNKHVTWTLFGSYTYLGKVGEQSYQLRGAAGDIAARTAKLKVHALDVKFGVKVSF